MRNLFWILLLTVIAVFVFAKPYDEATSTSNEPISSFGRGIAYDLDWHPSGDVLAVASARGLWLLDRNFQITEMLFASKSEFMPQILEWSTDGQFLAVYDPQTNHLTVLRWSDKQMIFDEGLPEHGSSSRIVCGCFSLSAQRLGYAG